MLHADKVLLALLMLRIHIKGVPSEPAYEAQWDMLLGRSELLAAKGGRSIFSFIFIIGFEKNGMIFVGIMKIGNFSAMIADISQCCLRTIYIFIRFTPLDQYTMS